MTHDHGGVPCEGAVTITDMRTQVLHDSAADADALGCTQEARRCLTIAGAGTSADAQLAVFEAHEPEGHDAALRAVSEWIASATLQ